ncbi:carbohydrate ABC transporter permease [uncultured Roseibium sp.]|uniref:carbohydrate ABC transporter permease n=1 Tax=uncultured Roseibium sp. TaxID=1936171 RepID=UPI002621554B|nr:carbohydrate ABC transporter permease [uncultured Roseibium sp.]
MSDLSLPANGTASGAFSVPSFRFSATETLKHLVLILGSLIVLLPFYVMLSYSFKSPAEIMQNIGGFFGAQESFRDDYCVKLGKDIADCMVTPAIYNYTTAFHKAPLVRYLLNGVIITASIFFIQVLVALPCAYALAKLRFWGREAVFGLVLFCLLIPVHAIALPLYIMLAKLGLTNSYAALVIPWTISVFGIFLMRQFFMTVPDDLIDAARMDGMSEFSIIWNVMLPTAVPALLAFAIFSVVAHWNDYFWPRIVITGNRDLFTPPLGLREFKGDADGDNFGPMMATATVIVAPLIIAFLIAQRRFIEGITLSGMK